jgi:hypothetical protein
MMAVRRAGVVLIVALLAVGLGGALAGAKKKHEKRKGHVWGSKITLAHPSPTRFTGTVDSSLAACFKGRLVNVFYTDPASGQTALLSVQRADGKGRYEVDLTQAAYPGVYQAQAAKERLRARKARQTCRAANSPIFGI